MKKFLRVRYVLPKLTWIYIHMNWFTWLFLHKHWHERRSRIRLSLLRALLTMIRYNVKISVCVCVRIQCNNNFTVSDFEMVYMKTRRFSSECLCCVRWQNVSLYKIDVEARVNNGHRIRRRVANKSTPIWIIILDSKSVHVNTV